MAIIDVKKEIYMSWNDEHCWNWENLPDSDKIAVDEKPYKMPIMKRIYWKIQAVKVIAKYKIHNLKI